MNHLKYRKNIDIGYVSIFEYERDDLKASSTVNSWISRDYNFNIDNHKRYNLEYHLNLKDNIKPDKMIVGVIIAVYINQETLLPCACDIFAFNNCSNNVDIVASINYKNYKQLFKIMRVITEKISISINDIPFKQLKYDGVSNKYKRLLVSSDSYQIIYEDSKCTKCENIPLY